MFTSNTQVMLICDGMAKHTQHIQQNLHYIHIRPLNYKPQRSIYTTPPTPSDLKRPTSPQHLPTSTYPIRPTWQRHLHTTIYTVRLDISIYLPQPTQSDLTSAFTYHNLHDQTGHQHLCTTIYTIRPDVSIYVPQSTRSDVSIYLPQSTRSDLTSAFTYYNLHNQTGHQHLPTTTYTIRPDISIYLLQPTQSDLTSAFTYHNLHDQTGHQHLPTTTYTIRPDVSIYLPPLTRSDLHINSNSNDWPVYEAFKSL